MSEIQIRNASFEEMAIIIELATLEGWNLGKSDNDIFYQADSTGFILMVYESQVLGSVSSVAYREDFGFIGFHIIQTEFRRQGLGRKLLNVAVERLGDRNIGLNCFEHQEEYYKKAGFKSAHKIFTYKGVCNGKIKKIDNIVSPLIYSIERLLDCDKKYFPTDRKEFISKWINQSGSVVLAKLEEDKFSGYGLICPCLSGYKIAPLFCDNPKIAEELLTTLIGHFPKGTDYYIDIPDKNRDGILIAEKMNMQKVTETIRMYTKTEPDIPLNNIYGFSSFELG